MAQPSRGEQDAQLLKKLDWISEREGEDAHLTGGTRSLHRRLLALNTYESSVASAARPSRGSVKRQSLSA